MMSMMVLDMTAQLAPVLWGTVALLALSFVALVDLSVPRGLAKGALPTAIHSKPRRPVTNAIAPASA